LNGSIVGGVDLETMDAGKPVEPMSSGPDAALVSLYLVTKGTSAVEDTCSIGRNFALDREGDWGMLLVIAVELLMSAAWQWDGM
jgi:hypothetical protein